MALHPISSELIHDQESDQLIKLIWKHPSMYVNPATVDGVAAYIEGFNAGRGGSPLLSMREWLVVRARGGNNLSWWSLVRREITGDPNIAGVREEEPELLLELCSLILAYLAYRKENGLSKIFWDYAEWLRRETWYSGPLPRIDAIKI